MASNAGANSALKVCLLKFQTSGRSISHRHGFWCTLINGKQPVRSDSACWDGIHAAYLPVLPSLHPRAIQDEVQWLPVVVHLQQQLGESHL